MGEFVNYIKKKIVNLTLNFLILFLKYNPPTKIYEPPPLIIHSSSDPVDTFE